MVLKLLKFLVNFIRQEFAMSGDNLALFFLLFAGLLSARSRLLRLVSYLTFVDFGVVFEVSRRFRLETFFIMRFCVYKVKKILLLRISEGNLSLRPSLFLGGFLAPLQVLK